MKIQVPLGELARKMNAISSVVPAKTTMPILSTVLVAAEAQAITLSATDLDISVTSRVNGSVEKGGSIAVPARKMAEIFKSLSGETAELENEGEKLTVTCGRSRFTVVGRGAEDFPKLPQQEKRVGFTIDAGLLGRLVHKTAYGVSNDLTRPYMCGVLWEVDSEGLTLVATDGHRLAKAGTRLELGSIDRKTEVIVPPKALSTLRAYTEKDEQIRIGIGDNSVSFEMEDVSIYSRLLEGPFPSYEKVIPTKNNKELVVSREGLAAAAKRVSILADALTHRIVFSLEKDRLTIHVTTQELGEAREELEAGWKEEPMDIGYNAAYLQDILRTIDGDEISFLLDRPDSAGLVVPVDRSGDIEHLCILMPLRIN